MHNLFSFFAHHTVDDRFFYNKPEFLFFYGGAHKCAVIVPLKHFVHLYKNICFITLSDSSKDQGKKARSVFCVLTNIKLLARETVRA